ncbi:SpoIIE family protein phosphatase [Cellulomonas bogoriensis]|uniref:Histidine kinase n=1 Tax=Cellulomonas bogoriensis 69B4 = DSM 16987 TaxID=1386082 RepID=A0A0A0C0K2_9CELL|nr:SpoIIE family protein phosphatase [Cellulomonas bogoriensis]KGM13487.1 histidine kinase [Cellulomonas bogoriensis 69B4 = DSM 16987]
MTAGEPLQGLGPRDGVPGTPLHPDLALTEVRAQVAMEAAGIGVFDWDLVSGRLTWDDRLQRIFGYRPGEFDETIEAFNARLHPEDATRVAGLLAEALDTCGSYAAEYRVLHPDGGLRWVRAHGRALAGPQGGAVRLVGAAYDTTARRDEEARVARVLESMPTAFFSVDPAWRFTYVNAEAERVLGQTREELLGQDLWERFPFAVGGTFEDRYRTSMDTGVPVAFEAYYPAPLDRWYEVRAWPAPDGLSVYFHDVTLRRAAQAQVEQMASRSALVARVAGELAGTLDAEEAVARLARIVVPTLAEWCIVSLIDQERPGPEWRRLRDIGSWHQDPGMRARVERYAQVRLPSLSGVSFVAEALRTRVPVVSPSRTTEAIASLFGPGEAYDLIHELAPEEGVVLPLVAQGRALGLLTLYGPAGRGGVTADGAAALDTAAEVAHRAAMALDHARLFAQQQKVAEELQRSLLTRPPRGERLRIAVRYQPAAEVARVGGDWYDAFEPRPGVTTLVIGDVVGHDVVAAASMGQARSLLRGIAVTTGCGPAELLERLDTAMHVLSTGMAATALVAELVQSPSQEADGSARLTWSSAGHLPPFALGPRGEVRDLGAGPHGQVDNDLLLGIAPDRRRREHTTDLPPGWTLILYTDGLVERRGEAVRDGVARLRAVLAEMGGADPETLCDALLGRMLPTAPADDVALAAVQVR